MRNVIDCINAFIPLLSTEYELVLGRKGVAVTLRILFDKKDCFHLMGLQYLVDRPELSRDRGKVFDEIADGTIATLISSAAVQSGRSSSRWPASKLIKGRPPSVCGGSRAKSLGQVSRMSSSRVRPAESGRTASASSTCRCTPPHNWP